MNKLFPNKWRRKTKDVVKSVMDVHKSSYTQHLRSKMHEDNQRFFPANFFNEVKNSKPKNTTQKPKYVKVPTLKELSMKKLLIKP